MIVCGLPYVRDYVLGDVTLETYAAYQAVIFKLSEELELPFADLYNAMSERDWTVAEDGRTPTATGNMLLAGEVLERAMREASALSALHIRDLSDAVYPAPKTAQAVEDFKNASTQAAMEAALENDALGIRLDLYRSLPGAVREKVRAALLTADRSKAVVMAKLVKYLWVDSYVELMNDNGLFFKSYCPKIIQLIGSKAYNEQGSVVLGTAEGGMKITFYNVNELDPNNLSISFLNEWFFETMHHEFAHILHQTKNYPTDFKQISTDYQGPSWLNLQDKEAHQRGYITAYASNAPDEDFVELIANYVTHDEAWWNDVLEDAGDAGKEKIDRKFKIVKDYMQESWKIDLDKLREIVQRRSANLSSVDVSDDF